ncbi:MAG: capsular biosynthesis protein, partial [Myxococcota bacterium]
MFEAFANRRVLMLQGPMGPFFWRVAKRLRALGATVTKINFNAGDHLYYRGSEVIAYRGTFEEWSQFFEGVVRARGIEAVLLFGDCRPYHRVAIQHARGLGVDVYVFEEGYLRPDFVTLELSGVTGNSAMPRDPSFYRKLQPGPLPEPRPVGQVLPAAACYAAGYAMTHGVLGRRYPHYRHHRDIRPLRQGLLWARGGLRRLRNGWRDRRVDGWIESGRLTPYYVVPLQVHLDAQLRHCPFDDVEDFVREVVRSFAEHGPRQATLLVKHHPFDRPYRDYGELLTELGRRYG